ncbi:TetR/AcrR family transcriptional regulator [Arachnia propionica]|uniref:TetR/AcrR family transcriptional regulator n=1 Tax=Arachnia propionica TaxID=1750 RepID=A0A3P1TDQ7_9ACTN|nr:TetR family transcriptional regulator [Arachnia propionica]RRD07370.1 TetR/AcrR family transcriptional regulator [Arachnia propionica]
MAWDTEKTRRRIKQAATTEFAQHGLHGTTIERIARLAGVNKERVYNYFGGKKELFAVVLHDEMSMVAQAVPITSSSIDDIGDYAGRVYDYHLEHPELIRLLRWEALSLDDDVVDEENRRKRYEEKTAAVAAGQEAGTITSQISAEHLTLFILSIAGWWATVPQVARMLCGPPSEQEHRQRRAAVVAAAKRLAAVAPEIMDVSR